MVFRDKINLDLKIPFDHRGQQGFPEDYYPDFKQLDNHIFYGTMYLEGSSRGRSSVKLIFKGDGDLKYEMFLTNFLELVKNMDVSKGVTGYWAFLKKGLNYGLTYIKD